MAMWMYPAADDGKSGRMPGRRLTRRFLGNGDLLAAVAGNARYPQFWFTTNDFWQMESAANWEFFHDNSSAKCDPAVSGGSPRPVGRMVFDIPAMEGAEVVYGAEVCHGRNYNNIDKFLPERNVL